MSAVRLLLPASLRTLGGVEGEVVLALGDDATMHELLDDLEQLHPALRGTLREPATRRRRPFVRFFACGEDRSHEPLDAPLPAPVLSGAEPLIVIGAIAGG